MTNAGVTRSVSTVEDGHLIEKSGFFHSDGAANVLGHKSKTRIFINAVADNIPERWQPSRDGIAHLVRYLRGVRGSSILTGQSA